jgi:hypothetical protein
VDTIMTAIYAAMDRLIELGGGTDDGAAEVLEDAGILGSPSCADVCPLAEWITRALFRHPDRPLWCELEVMPNIYDPRGGHVSWDTHLTYTYRRDHAVMLPAVLNDLANDIDRGAHPQLEVELYDESYEHYRDTILAARRRAA